MELLAPVKDKESAFIAINAQADAIYCSGPGFSARASAAISIADLEEIVEYAHIYNRKVYVTFNTLIDNVQLIAAIKYLDELASLCIDGIIVQDLGLLSIIKKRYPTIEIHASTQMHVHNLDGVRFLMSNNVKRVVVPREMSLDNVKYIKNNSNIEIEAFVHGALCTSYSGQCYYSYFDNGGSGNKGACKQNCRQLHSLNNEEQQDYKLSLKDLALQENILKLNNIIDSIKIEGRLKTKEYLYNTVSYYKEIMNGNLDQMYLDNSKVAFNRKYTTGHLMNDKNVSNNFRVNNEGLEIGKVISTNKEYIELLVTKPISRLDSIRIVNKNNQETGMNIDFLYDENYEKVESIESGKAYVKNKDNSIKNGKVMLVKSRVLAEEAEVFTQKYLYKKEIDISLYIEEGSKIIATTENMVHTSDFIVEKSLNKPTTKDEILKQFSKTLATPFEFKYVECTISDNVFIPKSLINKFRRDVIEAELNLMLKCEKEIPVDNELVSSNYKNFKGYKFICSTLEQAKVLQQYQIKEVYVDNILELHKFTNMFEKIIPVLPRVVNDKEVNKYFKIIKNYDRVMVSELGMYNRLKNEKQVELNYSFNITNTETLNFLNNDNVVNALLSLEVKDENSFSLENINTSVIAYMHKPYMIINYNLEKINKELLNKYIIRMKSYKNENLYVRKYLDNIEIFSQFPINKLEDNINADYKIVYFTIENASQVEKAMKFYI
ncbi:peptidase U32 family protein [Mycoplasma sp. P36-A1]|uniref:peptidase U32 family protein n=1 Tax=Mycoplasma sp. P36-A1 TaxID=3252900 RepID=UPI003C2FA995